VSEGDVVDFRPAHLIPLSWGIECPTCGKSHEIPEMSVAQDDCGAWAADASEVFIVCDECGVGVEAKPVEVRGVSYD